MGPERWTPDVWVEVSSAGRVIRFHRSGERWYVESIRFGGSELLADADKPLAEANPGLVRHLEELARGLLEDR